MSAELIAWDGDLVSDLPEPDCRYPVIVVEHKEHLVWIQADSPADALEQLKADPEWYELIRDNETCTGFWQDMSLPDRWDWYKVYDGGESYSGLDCNAHVEVHRAVQYAAKREADKAACAAAGHPVVKFYSSGDPYCETCWRITPEQLVADIRAAAAGSPS